MSYTRKNKYRKKRRTGFSKKLRRSNRRHNTPKSHLMYIKGGSQENQIKALITATIVINTYLYIKNSIMAMVALVKSYFIILRNKPSNMSKEADIFYLNYLFNILFYFEKNTDCEDIYNVDCMFLKQLILMYKEVGFYQAYLKHTAAYQIKNKMYKPTTVGGGVGGSMLYIIFIAIFTLSRVKAIHLDLFKELDRQLAQDLTIYDTDDLQYTQPHIYYNLYYSKIISMYNKYGSCVLQSTTLGLNSSNVQYFYNNYYKNLEGNELGSFGMGVNMNMVELAHMNTPIAIKQIKQAGYDAFNFIKTTYDTDIKNTIETEPFAQITNTGVVNKYLERVKRAQDIIDKEKKSKASTVEKIIDSLYSSMTNIFAKPAPPSNNQKTAENTPPANFLKEYELSAIKNQIHKLDTQYQNIIHTDEPIIITFAATLSSPFEGHAFNILYNTKTHKISIFDFNHISGFVIKNHLDVSKGYFQYNKNAEDAVRYIADPDDYYKNTPATLFISEPGFWAGTALEKINTFDKINTYIEDPLMYYSNITTGGDYNNPELGYAFYFDIETFHATGDVYVKRHAKAKHETRLIPYNNMTVPNANRINPLPNPYRSTDYTSNFNGWGCSTLNTCVQSAITLLDIYDAMLADTVFNIPDERIELSALKFTTLEKFDLLGAENALLHRNNGKYADKAPEMIQGHKDLFAHNDNLIKIRNDFVDTKNLNKNNQLAVEQSYIKHLNMLESPKNTSNMEQMALPAPIDPATQLAETNAQLAQYNMQHQKHVTPIKAHYTPHPFIHNIQENPNRDVEKYTKPLYRDVNEDWRCDTDWDELLGHTGQPKSFSYYKKICGMTKEQWEKENAEKESKMDPDLLRQKRALEREAFERDEHAQMVAERKAKNTPWYKKLFKK